MNVLILGGNSRRHQQWVCEVKAALEPRFDAVRLHDYRHWQTGDAEADVGYEIEAAGQVAKELGEYIIVAKSIGTTIATLGIASGTFSPTSCLFLGVPLSAVIPHFPDFTEKLALLPPTIFLQNSADPLASAGELKTAITGHPPKSWQLIINEDATHDYVDFKQITTLAESLPNFSNN